MLEGQTHSIRSNYTAGATISVQLPGDIGLKGMPDSQQISPSLLTSQGDPYEMNDIPFEPPRVPPHTTSNPQSPSYSQTPAEAQGQSQMSSQLGNIRGPAQGHFRQVKSSESDSVTSSRLTNTLETSTDNWSDLTPRAGYSPPLPYQTAYQVSTQGLLVPGIRILPS